jgi:hypothetical protein
MSSDNLFRRFWRQLRFDIPRMATHATSRRRVGIVFLTVLFLILAFSVIYGPLAIFEYKFGGGAIGLAAVVVMYGLAFSLRRGLKNRGNTIVLGISAAPAPSLRQAIFNQRLILATIVNRAAFEMAAQSKSPLNFETGIARAAMLDRLRAENLWETLPTQLRDCLAAPEGSWTKEGAAKALLHLDAVAVLTWMLNPQSELASLRTASSEGRDTLRLALLSPDPIAELNFLRAETELLAQRDPAIIYLKRLSNELIKRGVANGELETSLEEHAGAYMAYAASVGEAEFVAEDLPLGGVLVNEAPTEEILHLRGVAAVRLVTLQALQNALFTKKTVALQQMILSLA